MQRVNSSYISILKKKKKQFKNVQKTKINIFFKEEIQMRKWDGISTGGVCVYHTANLGLVVKSLVMSNSFCDPMDCSTPGFPVFYHLPELAQTHVHRVGDAIQPSLPLSSPSPPAFNLPSIRVFSSESSLHIRRPKYWSFSSSISSSHEYSGLISFRID